MADTRHGIAEYDAGEAGAAKESRTANTRHGIGDSDAGEAGAAITENSFREGLHTIAYNQCMEMRHGAKTIV